MKSVYDPVTLLTAETSLLEICKAIPEALHSSFFNILLQLPNEHLEKVLKITPAQQREFDSILLAPTIFSANQSTKISILAALVKNYGYTSIDAVDDHLIYLTLSKLLNRDELFYVFQKGNYIAKAYQKFHGKTANPNILPSTLAPLALFPNPNNANSKAFLDIY